MNKFPEIGKKVTLSKMTWITDLMWYDGPLISWLEDEEKNQYIFHWVDCDDIVERWLVTQLPKGIIDQIFKNEITFRNAYKLGKHFLCDKHNRSEIYWKVDLTEIPEDYFPAHDIYLNIEERK